MDEDLATVTWQWYRGGSEIVGATDGAGTIMSSYTPTAGDVGSVLRATAMYDDGEGRRQDSPGKLGPCCPSSARVKHSSVVPRPGSRLQMGDFRPRRPGKWPRTRLRARIVGAPVVASDPDVLTYSLDVVNDADAASF